MTAVTISLPGSTATHCSQIVLALANQSDRAVIYKLRHDVYAAELGQHALNPSGTLRDGLDQTNIYLLAKIHDEIAGFISVTPPGGAYSIDKYVNRSALPFVADDRLYEIRLLTVVKPRRGRELATLLMFAAFRWIEAHGGTRVMAIGRREVLDMYLRCGLQPLGVSIRSGAVSYELLSVTIALLRQRINSFGGLLERLEGTTDWRLGFPFHQPASCFHGGSFFESVGVKFDSLQRSDSVINADVLDAWFPPSPKVLEALHEFLPWLARTSPPTAAQGLTQVIAEVRGVAPENILPGAGSSDLIFRALRSWLRPGSQALILDPTYGEYAHVLERVIGCTTDRLTLSRNDNYAVELDKLEAAFADHYDLIVLVNPNSPTGSYIPRSKLEALLRRAPAETRVWIDETYIDYLDARESLERFAARSENVIVCKSMSKAYALSGLRIGYLCAGPHQLEQLRAITPPWIVSLLAQVAAVRALQDPGYYARRYRETTSLREALAGQLAALGLVVQPATANFLLCHLPLAGSNARIIIERCRQHGLFLRDAGPMGLHLGNRALRIAVKDEKTNYRMVKIIKQALVQDN